MGVATSTCPERYTDAAIEEALSRWPMQQPPTEMIPSRLLHRKNAIESDTTIFIVRSSAISYLPILHHFYIEFNDTEWHPGAPNDPIFEPKRDTHERSMKLRKIIECCPYCSKLYLRKHFERDKGFNLIFNNCQIQFGEIAESLLVLFFIATFIVGIILKSPLIIVINAVSLASIFVTSLHDQEIEYKTCNHIEF